MTARLWRDSNATEVVQTSDVHPTDDHIRGSMTLQEVANVTAVSVDQLKRVLDIAEDVPASERIGRQARGRGLSMADVRQMLLTNRH